MEQATEKQIKYAKVLGIANPEKYSKIALKELISTKLEDSPAETVKPEKAFENSSIKEDNKYTTMYVSYAKDIFVSIQEFKGQLINEEAINAMDLAIELVKRARDAFS
jgi:hypothetical protein